MSNEKSIFQPKTGLRPGPDTVADRTAVLPAAGEITVDVNGGKTGALPGAQGL